MMWIFPLNYLAVPEAPIIEYESVFESGLLQSFVLNITEKVRSLTGT